jgi:lipopolysaccharide transport system ATP-binding protein
MITVEVEGIYKKFSRNLGDSVRSGIRDILHTQTSRAPEILESEFWALENISFQLEQGDSLGILGANGSGKTTLLRVLNGTYKPTCGRFSIKEPTGSLIAAGAGFSPTLTGSENIFLSASLLGLSNKEIEKKYDSIVEFSELGDFLEMPLSHYSSGMSVRLAFSVATSVIPEVLLVDEVLAVGDIGFQHKCFERIRELRQNGTTLLIVSHSTETTWELCNKGLYIDNAKSEGIEEVKNVIAKYVNKSISRGKVESDTTVTENKGSLVDLLDASIHGENGPENDIMFRDRLTLEMKFLLHAPAQNAFIRVNISNEMYRPIATADSSLFREGVQNLGAGIHQLRIKLDEVNLKPGKYFVNLGVTTKGGGPHLGLFDEAITFEIYASASNPLYDFGLRALIDLPVEVLNFE